MGGDIFLAGYTLTAEEWRALDPQTRDELLGAAAGAVELYSGPDEDESDPQLLA
jgi:hypothetical protein